jgi:LEA14-like dessication related protein
MKKNSIRKGLVSLTLGIVLLASCAKPKNFDYLGFDNLKVLKLGIQETTVGMDVKFYNPNSALLLKKAEVDVHINNKYLGRTVIDSLISIPKKDTFIIPMVMKMETISAVSGILKSVGDSTVLVKLDGKALVGKSGIFLNYPIKYEGNQKSTKMLGIE